MTISASLFLITVGALLRWAVTAHVSGIDIKTVGTILIVIGVIGLVIGIYILISSRLKGTPPPY
jgi:hypothetical protein